jgi:N-acetylmuramoyl-L-alanine amidase
MKVIDHRLHLDDGTPVRFEETPNFDDHIIIRQHEYLVLHYTAGVSVDATIRTFKNENKAVSAQLIIGRDGSITQMVPFDRRAWHCGFSDWAGSMDLNKISIGIEFDDFGWLRRVNDRWERDEVSYPDEEVIEATHKFEFRSLGWHIFSDKQIEVGLEVSRLLIDHYKILDVVGHDDISTEGKVDPGPAFPMERFKDLTLPADRNAKILYRVVAITPLFKGAGDHHPILLNEVKIGIVVSILDNKRRWSLVSIESGGPLSGTQGWMRTKLLKRIREGEIE